MCLLLAPCKPARVDTVILGCTHYPLVAPMLQRFLGREVRLVTAGHALAASAQRILEPLAETAEADEGTTDSCARGTWTRFKELGTRFLQMPLGEVELVEIRTERRGTATATRARERILEQVQEDTREAMKAGERDRVTALRLVADALQKDAKEGGDDELRSCAASASAGASPTRPTARPAATTSRRPRRYEAKAIEAYLPAELSDDELDAPGDLRRRRDRRRLAAGHGQGDQAGDGRSRRARRRQAGLDEVKEALGT